MEIKIIYGPPGTGKTTTLLNIVEEELVKVSPNKIAYVSFTRQGVYEGRDRAIVKFNYKKDDFPYFKTLHSIAFNQAGMTRNKMISRDDYRKFSKAMGMNFTGYYTEEFFHTDDQYIFFDILHRNNPSIAGNYLDNLDMNTLKFVRNNYRQFKDQMGIVDFTNLIEIYCDTNKALPVDVAIIDEAQDLTTLQWKMVWIAFRNCKRIYIAGDDDQSIYEWSGADINQLMNIQGDQIVLSKTYRLPQTVWKYSKQIVEMIQKRISKDFRSYNIEGSIKYIESFEELQIDNDSSWLFLSRNNFFLKEIEHYLKYKGLIYFKKGKCSIEFQIINAIIYYEGIFKRKLSLNMIYKLLPYLNEDDMEQLKADKYKPWFEVFRLTPDEISYYRDIFSMGYDFNKNNIKINIRVETIHSAKGSEADNVVMITDITSNVHKNLLKNADSELRCYYVGITRTKKNLYLVTPKTQRYYDFYYREI
jgi:DNA helicase-2/ATP-dependent DNA helicase PcrA